MQDDPASLENLRDLAEPPAVSWYPLAPGWWVLIGVGAATGIYFGIRAWLRWRSNAYRRAALAELEKDRDLAGASEVLKRAALVAFPRAEVAALTGTAWCRWLEKTGRVTMPEKVREELVDGIYGRPGGACPPEVLEFSRAWITRHRVDATKGGKAC